MMFAVNEGRYNLNTVNQTTVMGQIAVDAASQGLIGLRMLYLQMTFPKGDVCLQSWVLCPLSSITCTAALKEHQDAKFFCTGYLLPTVTPDSVTFTSHRSKQSHPTQSHLPAIGPNSPTRHSHIYQPSVQTVKGRCWNSRRHKLQQWSLWLISMMLLWAIWHSPVMCFGVETHREHSMQRISCPWPLPYTYLCCILNDLSVPLQLSDLAVSFSIIFSSSIVRLVY